MSISQVSAELEMSVSVPGTGSEKHASRQTRSVWFLARADYAMKKLATFAWSYPRSRRSEVFARNGRVLREGPHGCIR
jgi:transposase